MAVLPADHFIADAARYRKSCAPRCIWRATPAIWWCSGIPPTQPETGYGYIEARKIAARAFAALPPWPSAASRKSRRCRWRGVMSPPAYFWNAGMFFWRVSTFLEMLAQLPSQDALRAAAARRNNRHARIRCRSAPDLSAARKHLRRLRHPGTCLARRQRSARLGDSRHVGWSDIGSWGAVYELLAAKPGENVSRQPLVHPGRQRKLFLGPGKFVAAIGVQRSGAGGNRRRHPGLPARTRARRGQNREVAREQKLVAAAVAPAILAPVRASLSSPVAASRRNSLRLYCFTVNDIQFGTDGWRGIIADDFTFENVRKVTLRDRALHRARREARAGVSGRLRQSLQLGALRARRRRNHRH